ncbi:hypothetical protein [Nonomuraea sp. PA05]|nr:hypothetical protein [Nonomuraea sp. PA05]
MRSTTRVPAVFTLIGADGRPYASPVPGTLGGHRRARLYGRRTTSRGGAA